MKSLMAKRLQNAVRGVLQAYGTTYVKKFLWNSEFSRGRWDCLDATPGDCVYPCLEKYANSGSILDLGCGSGSTGNELSSTAYHRLVGVDISDVAVEKSRRRTEENRREDKNHYICSDVFNYVPTGQFDVILFRDSIYYVPHGKIIAMLRRYSKHLKEGGVFIVRMWNGSDKYVKIVDAIESNFTVVEKHVFDQPDAVVMVFR